MRIVINIVLLLATVGLVYLLYSSIQEPIQFKKERTRREEAVIARLMQIRTAQEAFRDITGGYAPTFDTLTEVLTKGKFKIISVIGDPDDPNFTGKITYDTIFRPALDSIKALGIDLDVIRYIPFSEKKDVFDLAADTLTYQGTLVQVVECKAQRTTFMGRFGDISYAKYDKAYDPTTYLKFGNMTQPNLSGNWESR
ncbi:MAG: hypothetical protein KAX50_04615 [Saprospiraceae bacterium]|nr:hypothetical protein [Saprospiraceae bacterium]